MQWAQILLLVLWIVVQGAHLINMVESDVKSDRLTAVKKFVLGLIVEFPLLYYAGAFTHIF